MRRALAAGLLVGLSGAQLSISNVVLFSRNMSAGRGFICLAAILIARGKPFQTTLVAVLFGFFSALAIQLQSFNIPTHFFADDSLCCCHRDTCCNGDVRSEKEFNYMKFRNMAGFYLFDGEYVLLLYRVGSRVLRTPSWRNIGGHMEICDLNDPLMAALRELKEETGIEREDIENIRLKYVTLRYVNNEIRQNYYFFAMLKSPVKRYLNSCSEGTLEWVKSDVLFEREMPRSSRECLRHYLDVGKFN